LTLTRYSTLNDDNLGCLRGSFCISQHVHLYSVHCNFSGYHHLLFVSAPILASGTAREREREENRRLASSVFLPSDGRERRTETLPNRVRASNCRMRYSLVFIPVQGSVFSIWVCYIEQRRGLRVEHGTPIDALSLNDLGEESFSFHLKLDNSEWTF
jgi:hypothetical protein